MKNELNIAINAAKEAGKIILKYYNSEYVIKEKGFGNPVTTADEAADDYLKKILTSSFPGYGWLSEETIDSSDRLSKSRIWIVDPIDGTKEFINGIDEFVVSVGLAEEGCPVLGVIYNPVKEEIFYASKGEGSYLNDLQIFCSESKPSTDMILLISNSERREGLWKKHNKKFKSLNAIGSVAYKIALTAAGIGDMFATLRPKNEWDVCAADCIINEARGKLVNLNAEKRIYNQKNPLIDAGLVAGSIENINNTIKKLL
tara:strand:+ start:6102 stop:6875 length:774 start_codon:yes stop_codon:yes gene_type:complete